ncbi:hypothetical protein AVEN_217075-1 [Araneus ventricosus]|uniref:Uncharacterized protein n=1 Tax=Araneus ventricosus TaxID=182803 RepID=A0A4Y2ITG9_ARAVE|nr:hypothetical protein AVEN_216957-1 [Araneus ventricosus]GBN39837.1 hypothetical protein AVEN_217075-1 [Araneus ventricosus]
MGLPPVLSAPNEIKPFPSPQNAVEYPVTITTAIDMSDAWVFSRGGRTVPVPPSEAVHALFHRHPVYLSHPVQRILPLSHFTIHFLDLVCVICFSML